MPAAQRRFLASFRHRPRLIAAAVVAVVVYVLTPAELRIPTRALIAWNVGAWGFLAAILQMFHMTRGNARSHARAEDEGEMALMVVTVVAALAALAAIVWELGPVKDMTGWIKAAHLVLVAATVLSAWAFMHTMFALHYAGGFYRKASAGGIRGGLIFPDCNEPGWTEFAYQAFVVGCAFATADVNVTSREMRQIVLAQGIIAFVFNTVILALTINIGAGLV
jgi:uncharacterized membrane protein